jgi:hypothetical protein
MKPSPPSPPRTVIVIDDSPSEVSSFLCSLLDAHALPYAVQVIDPGALPFRHRTPRRLRWLHGLAWGIGLGLVVSIGAGGPWLWQAGRLPRGPISPPPHSDDMAGALLGAVAPPARPVAAVRPPAQSQTPAAQTRLTSLALGDTPAGGRLPRPRASGAQTATSLQHPAPARTRAGGAAHVRHLRKRYAPWRPAPRGDLITVSNDAEAFPRPRAVERAQVVGAHRPEEGSGALPAPKPSWGRGTPDPALEGEHPWNRHLVNDTGA